MRTQIDIGGISLDVIFKDIKNVHLSVHPPTGRVRIAAPSQMSLESIRLFGISKIGWIKKHQGQFKQQPRETPREYIERESHYVWGHRYLLRIKEDGSKATVSLGSRALDLTVPKGAPFELREEILTKWYRAELRERAAPVLAKWAKKLHVDLSCFYIQRMKTKWGSSNPTRRTVRLNLELAKFSLDCLEYVALHELAHFVAPDHGREFLTLLDGHMPGWRTIRNRLNEGPLPTIR
jgi:predicted metal-dependent hydrolase